ncbi:PREDICTED: olfactory receptor 476-like [Nanorana parkeri]|uniref:olfactory receptor 476-like n=1 Tax=Nanorana parkeri TaxID=125878 RepID=UPI000854593E|nr:PREDICTED: olfactory receptor 476-like [Nanorana parkeri]
MRRQLPMASCSTCLYRAVNIHVNEDLFTEQNICKAMDEQNRTIITIHLLGLQTPQSLTFLVFFVFLLIYCLTICGNFLIISMVSYSKTLHSPMYFYLSQLALSDILLSTDVLPNMLNAILENTTIISISECITQLYFFGVSITLECLLLTVMSYDRYLAICKPLHYSLLMSHQFCWITIITSWTLRFLAVLTYTSDISKLHFCGPNIIDHFFCDLDPILQLSCSSTFLVQLLVTLSTIFFAIIPFFVIIASYIYIVFTIFKIPTMSGRQKVFSTCSSHLTVVSIFYGTLLFVYLIPSRGQSWNITKFVSLMYTVVTPLMNPIIYSLRNADLKKVVGKIINNVMKLHFCSQ